MNAAVAATLVAVLAALALVVNPPSPPGIAEFAPRAAKPISKAPLGQAAPAGQGPASCVRAQGCPVTPTPRPTAPRAPGAAAPRLGVPSALQCYAWPDGSVTQTFDPQSPPCVASWPQAAKGNGGDTARGVTKSEITVAVPASGATNAAASAYARFFNTRFQLYGRALRVVVYPDPYPATPNRMRAAAQSALQHEPFAVTVPDGAYTSSAYDVTDFVGPVVTSKTIAVAGEPTAGVTEAGLRQHTPYLWSFPPTLDTTLSNLGELICTNLPQGEPARYAQGDTAALPRKLAVGWFHDPASGADPDNGPLLSQLASCGIRPKLVAMTYEQQQTSDWAVTMGQLKADGYTTLVWRGGSLHTGMAMGAATRAGFQPEWLLPGDPTQSEEVQYGGGAPVSMLGIAWWSKFLKPASEPYVQALQPRPADVNPSQPLYSALQLLASGIQAAGPRLTAETFSDGLQGFRFPNPGSGRAPSWQARVGFEGGTAGVTDFAAWWWDGVATSPHTGRSGAFCYVERGRRWSLSTGWPKDLAFYPSSRQCT